jgi:hypothetical protein
MVKNVSGISLKDSGHQTCDAVLQGEWLPKFRGDVVHSSVRVQESMRSGAFLYAILSSLLLLVVLCLYYQDSREIWSAAKSLSVINLLKPSGNFTYDQV